MKINDDDYEPELARESFEEFWLRQLESAGVKRGKSLFLTTEVADRFAIQYLPSEVEDGWVEVYRGD
jgi:hypothetical protein